MATRQLRVERQQREETLLLVATAWHQRACCAVCHRLLHTSSHNAPPTHDTCSAHNSLPAHAPVSAVVHVSYLTPCLKHGHHFLSNSLVDRNSSTHTHTHTLLLS